MRAIAEAPSKAIIVGEHFVVHGGWALAAALPRKVRVEVSPFSSYRAASDRLPAGSTGLRPLKHVVDAMAREFSVSPAVKIFVSSSIPQGAGLGSSASTMVAAAAAVSRLYSLGLGTDELVAFAMIGERGIHGRPSGVDPTVCAFGGVLLFKPGEEPRKVEIRGERRLVVSFSGVSRRTKAQIRKVSLMKERFPRFLGMLAASVGDLSLEAAELLQRGDLKGVGSILTIDHAALRAVGVSSPELDAMVELLASEGAYGAKLTGGGGGGSVIAVAPEAKEKSIVSGLTARGFETYIAKVPVEGVKSWLER
ncbi:MAG: mevalonate kinase [Nitrososphaerota archaeon]|nr:mevalonate kinase [Nitrososphaerota archaeon]